MTDDERLCEFATALAEQILSAIPGWVQECVGRRLPPNQYERWQGEVADAGIQAAEDLAGPLRTLLSQDIDQQRTTPLTIVRGGVAHAARVLTDAGVPHARRDADAVRLHPDDVYDLTPGGYLDLGQSVQDASLMWGAAKAHVHIQRRKAEGLR